MLLDPPAGWKPDWLSSPFVKQIFDALGEDQVRVVGGAVRDSLLDEAVEDVDMATTHDPETCKMLLETSGLKVIPTGLKHGTVTAVMEGQSCEITTLRKDVETDGRHAVVAFTDSWYEDAARRDFTINALYATADGRIFDPFDGLTDLKTGMVRFIGDAEERIREDALRIYRFFRFSARFATTLDEGGLKACGDCASMAAGLSYERIRDELLKLLRLENPISCVEAMDRIDILPHLETDDGSSGAEPENLERHIERELKNGVQSLPLVRLGALYPGCRSEQIGQFFRLSRQQVAFLQKCRDAAWDMFNGQPANSVLYRYGQDVVRECLKDLESWRGEPYVKLLSGWVRPEFPVSGGDLIALGFEPGEKMGKTLRKMESRWIGSDFQLSKPELLEAIDS